jgi:hypothetical protein
LPRNNIECQRQIFKKCLKKEYLSFMGMKDLDATRHNKNKSLEKGACYSSFDDE